MNSELPAYYSRLAPFAEVFQHGNPILTYHKLGPRPAKVRLKGLYLDEALFTRQLEELSEAGYVSGSLLHCVAPRARAQVVITFDDGYVNVLRHGLRPLAKTGFRAIQFLVAGLLGKTNQWDVPLGEAPEPLMDATQVREWLAAGHDIGSHTMTHPLLTQVPLDAAKEEISASKKKLEDLFGNPVKHFCYPAGDWNPAIRDLVAAAGYETACTVEPGVNGPNTNPFELKRFTARYPSRNLKAMWRMLRLRGKPSALAGEPTTT
jgi:peptidoglycan/xylan/chitin deacetylase (PgdA/CDA1 family)